MKFELKIEITDPDGVVHDHDIAVLDKSFERASDIGLTLSESKELLLNLQQVMVEAQTKAYTEKQSHCSCCNKKLRSKGKKSIRFRSLFGDISLPSQRFYHCACDSSEAKTFSPLNALLNSHVAPEMLWLETKWASLVSYGASVSLLKDVLPIGDKLNAETLRRHLAQTAQRMEAELEEESFSYVTTREFERQDMSAPNGPIVVGIDGGYVRSCDKGGTHFEVTVGKSIPEDGDSRYLGLVQSHDTKPRRRLNEVLLEQGWQENQHVTFLTDGGDSVVKMAKNMAPSSEHLLDWFHITMRITVIGQYLKGLVKHNPEEAENLSRELRRIKGYLWNGNVTDAVQTALDLEATLGMVETKYSSFKALLKHVSEFEVYISNNGWMIPNYAERRRYGERVSTGFVESTVNTLVGKRFNKKQQMRWSKLGAHNMLQTRARTLDGTLRQKFEQWYPGMANDNQQAKLAA